MADITRIAVIGGGLIGQSWAALFLAHGMRVTVQDVAEGVEARVRDAVAAAWPDLERLGMAQGPVPQERLRFATTIGAACEGVDLVQECGPDRIDAKRAILAEIEAGAPEAALIASSTSSLLASDIQAQAVHPGRVLVAHPFNPPHLIPLVELVPGKATDAEAMARAAAFYTRIGREVITLKRDVVGHVANRLTSAVFREAVHLVSEGYASAGDVDRAMAFGPGLRWALMGPFATYHLGGGDGGFRHYMAHLGPTQAARWAELGDPVLSDEVSATLVDEVEGMLAGLGEGDLKRLRDEGLVGLLRLKGRIGGETE
ncbi:3-hydroxyacyl-CoA dehydrogenase NAD-binding domain-containing protein [Rhodobacteraceae bacterium D3-12]|nr:3-hydroxyacyl-CoA dehydrogenase NAD-binding domain-containing protein [Rhodobacteraceae bacterium D3-12]